MPRPPARNLVLASSSPYRRALLERLQLPFACRAPDIDEDRYPDETIADLCTRLAREKAAALASAFPDHLIIGSDQSAAVDGTHLEKPGNLERATRQLKLLAGRSVSFYTAVAVLDSHSGVVHEALDVTEITVRTLSDDAIADYLNAEQPWDCAGSFKVEGLGISLFDSVTTTDPSALTGLPLIALCQLLRRYGIQIP